MRILINLVLVAVIAFLVYLLYSSIVEPINFKTERTKRENAVVDRLMKIRDLQDAYRDITGYYAPTFDTLKYVLTNDSFRTIKVLGDPDDPENPTVTYDTSFTQAFDSLTAMGFKFDSIEYVPYGEGSVFQVSADTITHQKIKVPVVEVGIERSAFMGKYKDPRFARYDDNYDPSVLLKFGDMRSPTTAGNWER